MAYWNSLMWFPTRNAVRATSTEFAEIVDSPDFTTTTNCQTGDEVQGMETCNPDQP